MESIPELLYKNNDELNDLISCEDKLEDFIESLPDVAAILNRCNQLSEENMNLASEMRLLLSTGAISYLRKEVGQTSRKEDDRELVIIMVSALNYHSSLNYQVAATLALPFIPKFKENIELKNEYEKARDQTLTKVQELTGLQSNFEQLTVQHQQLTEKLAPANIQELTLIAASQSEEESEKIAEEFLQKNLDIGTFLATYVEKRIESHQRKFKSERLGTQLRELQRSGF